MRNKIHSNTSKFIEDIGRGKKRTVDFLGYKILLNPKVFPIDSDFSFSSKITAKIIPKNAGVVLDVGTGSGVQAIVAVKRGAQKVLAIDIDNFSLKNASENVEMHNLSKIVETRKSNLFKNIKNSEKFDLIISQLPFADVSYKGKFKGFLFDEGFKLHERLLNEAKNYLNPKGKILIPSGDVANEKKLNELILKNNYKILKIHSEKFNGLEWKVYVLTRI